MKLESSIILKLFLNFNDFCLNTLINFILIKNSVSFMLFLFLPKHCSLFLSAGFRCHFLYFLPFSKFCDLVVIRYTLIRFLGALSYQIMDYCNHELHEHAVIITRLVTISQCVVLS